MTSSNSRTHPLRRDALIALVAERQHGVASRRQLLDAGLSEDAISRRIASGLLHPHYRGVYAVGHPALSSDGLLMAAVLAAGPGSALSHRSAASLLGLRATARRAIDVVSPRQPPERAGITGHRSRLLGPEDLTAVRGIPVTTVARTLADLAPLLDSRGLDRVWRRAEELRAIDVFAIARQLRPGRAGTAALRRLLAAADEGLLATLTRSELEILFLELVAAAGLPTPLMNVPIEVAGGRYEADALWPSVRLVVELDGWSVHGTRSAFEDDRRRDADLARAGFRVVRFTWRRVVTDPVVVGTTLADLLR